MSTKLTKIKSYREFFMKPVADATASEIDKTFGLSIPSSLDELFKGKDGIAFEELTLEETLVCCSLAANDRTGATLLVVAFDGDTEKATEFVNDDITTVTDIIQKLISHSEAVYIALVKAGFNQLRHKLQGNPFDDLMKQLLG